MEVRHLFVALCLLTTASAKPKPFNPKLIRELYVKDFESDEPKRCTTSDVDLNNVQALAFFKRAKVLDHRTMVENYAIAPCYIVGTLMYRGVPCEWAIYAGATGFIKSPTYEWYFACDDCDDLFRPQPGSESHRISNPPPPQK